MAVMKLRTTVKNSVLTPLNDAISAGAQPSPIRPMPMITPQGPVAAAKTAASAGKAASTAADICAAVSTAMT